MQGTAWVCSRGDTNQDGPCQIKYQLCTTSGLAGRLGAELSLDRCCFPPSRLEQLCKNPPEPLLLCFASLQTSACPGRAAKAGGDGGSCSREQHCLHPNELELEHHHQKARRGRGRLEVMLTAPLGLKALLCPLYPGVCSPVSAFGIAATGWCLPLGHQGRLVLWWTGGAMPKQQLCSLP